MKKLNEQFYLNNTLAVAKNLLGKYLVREFENEKIILKITETEAYIGENDKACHAYKGKTKRTAVMFEKGSLAYVYLIYGMYYCLNVVTEDENYPAAVLIRGCEVIENFDLVSFNRFNKKYDELNSYQKKNLLNGPGKICKALKITQQDNGKSLINSSLYITEGEKINKNLIKCGKRINIDYAQEAKDFLWRFYL